MLKIVAIGNLTNDVELKMNEATGKPYAILRIASDRRYKDKDGNHLTDYISIKVRSVVQRWHGRAAGWPLQETLRRLPSQTSRIGSPASSLKRQKWSSCPRARLRKIRRRKRYPWRVPLLLPQRDRYAEYRN